MLKASAKVKDGKTLIVLGITAGNIDQIKKDNPLLIDFGFAGEEFKNCWFAIVYGDITGEGREATERLANTLASFPEKGKCLVMSVDDEGLDDMVRSLTRMRPEDQMPLVEEIVLFYGDDEASIERMLRQHKLIDEKTKVLKDARLP